MVGGSSLPGSALVGRNDELRSLATAAREAAAGTMRACLVSGPPGAGKTALVRAFTAATEEARVRWATGDEDEASLPYGVVEQLGLYTCERTTPEPDPFTVGASLIGALAGGPASPFSTLVIDDAHWGDRPSLVAINFALRRLRADPVLVVIVCRDEALERLPEGLARLATDEGTHLRLGSLTADDLVQLSARAGSTTLSRKAAERLRDHTGGNALHALTVMAELVPAALESSAEAVLPAPRSFAALIAGRLGRCGRDTRALVSAASVLGHHSPVTSAARLAGLADPSPALDEAVVEGLLVAPPPGRHIGFVHPLVRAAIYHDLPPGTRFALHAEAAALVGDESTALRHRAAASMGADAELAAAAAELAERHTSRGSWAAAAEAFAAASSLAVDTAEQERWALRRIDSLLLHGGVAEAAGEAEEAHRFAPSPLRDYILGELSLFSGAFDEASRRLVAAWEGCRHPDDDALAANIADRLGHLSINAGRGEETVHWARQALALGPSASTPDATMLLCMALGQLGRAAEGLAELQGGAPISGSAADDDALVGRGVLELWGDDLAAARTTLERAETLLAGRGPLQMRLIALFYLADAEYRAGQWDRAGLHGQLAASLARDAEQVWTYALVHAVAAFPLAAQGQWAPARSHVTAAVDAAAALGDRASTLWSSMAAARLAQAERDFAGVCAALRPVQEVGDFDGRDEPGIQPWRSLLADALIGLGRYDEAEATLAAMEDLAWKRAHPTEAVRTGRLRGLLLAAQGHPTKAEAAFAEAHEADPERRCPFEAALLEAAHGSVLRRAGQRRAAAAALGAAADRLAALGAQPYLDAVQREAAACGLTPRSRHSSGRDHLTPQEAAVATLVVSGLSNKAVAAELVVSQKTVEYHLGHIFAKLEVGSRGALATRLLGTEQG
jgi:DNA-binding CsgD family transcriptional regulator